MATDIAPAIRPVRRVPPVILFFSRPKGLLILVLLMLVSLAGTAPGYAVILPGLLAATLVAMVVDAPILRYRRGKWVFPDGALLTGMIVAMILTPRTPWYVAAVTAAVGVISKHLLRVRTANIFNPAALGLLATFHVFDPGQDWWGALPEVSPYALLLLIFSGLYIAERVNKLPALLSFLGIYYLLFMVASFVGDPLHVAEIFRAPDLHAALFYGCFMVTDPPTSPPRPRDQLIFGAITAAVSFAVFELSGAATFLLSGLLAANAWEAWRRLRARRRRLSHPVKPVVHPAGA